jgi:hypothetical protein
LCEVFHVLKKTPRSRTLNQCPIDLPQGGQPIPWKNPLSAHRNMCRVALATPPKAKLQSAVSNRPRAMNLRGSLRSEMAPMTNLPTP